MSQEPDAVSLEAGRRLFASGADYMLSVHHLADVPETGPVEIAFAGRSNVGKSSLINALTRRKKLAHTSNTPGRTQALNYYRISDDLRLVDMPGYGYAKAPKDAVRTWTKLIHAYLRGRPTLRRVFVLIDARHGIKETDLAILGLLDNSAVSYQIVLTKTDKITAATLNEVQGATAGAIAKRAAAYPDILLTSAQKNTGIDHLRAAIADLLA